MEKKPFEKPEIKFVWLLASCDCITSSPWVEDEDGENDYEMG